MSAELTPYFIQEKMKCGDKGDAEACYDVGEFFYSKQNYEEAFKWYKKTTQCKDPNPNVYFNLGYAFQYGEGTEIDMFAAFNEYRKAAAQDIPQAIHNLAYFYELGIVVSQDKEKADELCRRATQILNSLQTELYKEKLNVKAIAERQSVIEKKITEERECYQKIKKELDEKQIELIKAEKTIKVLNEEETILQSQCNELKRKLNDEQNKYLDAQKKGQELQILLDVLNSKNEAIELVNQERQNQIVEQRAEILRRLKIEENLKSEIQKKQKESAEIQKLKQEADQQVINLKNEGESLSKKNADQQRMIRELHNEVLKLYQKKPFLRKQTILCWLDIILFVLLFFQMKCASDYSYSFYMSPVLVFSVPLTILSIILAKLEKYIAHGIVQIVVGVLVCFIITGVSGIDIEFLGVCLSFMLTYIWCGIISFLKEIT